MNQSNGNGTSLVWTNTLTYDFNIKEHHISALLGSETTKYDGESTGSYGVNLTAGFDDWEHAYVENTEKGCTCEPCLLPALRQADPAADGGPDRRCAPFAPRADEAHAPWAGRCREEG